MVYRRSQDRRPASSCWTRARIVGQYIMTVSCHPDHPSWRLSQQPPLQLRPRIRRSRCRRLHRCRRRCRRRLRRLRRLRRRRNRLRFPHRRSRRRRRSHERRADPHSGCRFRFSFCYFDGGGCCRRSRAVGCSSDAKLCEAALAVFIGGYRYR